MKSTELRIGNFIYYNNNPESNEIYDVVRVNLNDIHSLQLKIDGEIDWRYGVIPLDEQWFEKFGGIKSEDYDDCYTIRGMRWTYNFFKNDNYGDDPYWTCEQVIGITHIEYVHQLQNLFFALSGEELELIK